MISETRQILFSNSELIRVIKDFDRSRKQVLPPGEITECKLSMDPISAKLTFDTVWTDNKVVVINASSLAAALIYACARKRIPLPRRAEKTLRVVDDRLSLDLSLDILTDDYATCSNAVDLLEST